MKEFLKEVEKEFSLPEGSIKGRSRKQPLSDIRASIFMVLYDSNYNAYSASGVLNRDRTSAYNYLKRFDNIKYDKILKSVFDKIKVIHIRDY